MNTVSIVNHSGSRKGPEGSGIARFTACRTVRLGNVDSRNVSVGVVLATLDRWAIELREGVAYLRATCGCAVPPFRFPFREPLDCPRIALLRCGPPGRQRWRGRHRLVPALPGSSPAKTPDEKRRRGGNSTPKMRLGRGGRIYQAPFNL
jgi:hypothetical protein